jgi:23S rRNA pseudouridine1911/1915/1917 synthase
MAHTFNIVVPAGKKKERLDVFLTNHIENATRSKVQQAIKQKLVLVDGKAVKTGHILTPGSVIYVEMPKPPPQDVVPENIPLQILFEDEDLIVLHKPAGMVTHPAHGNYTGTLVNALLYHCNRLSIINDETRPGIVHRLDKDTSGLMVVAKTDSAHVHLARQFSNRTIQREYWSIVWGRLRQRSGTIEAQLGRSTTDRKKVAVVAGGKDAITTYTVLEQFDYLSLLSLKLQTGRTHQIRVHLAHIGHPVFGDPTYNGRRIVAGSKSAHQKAEVQLLLDMISRQALHAKTLGFVHPSTRARLFFDSDLPRDMAQVLAHLHSLAGEAIK